MKTSELVTRMQTYLEDPSGDRWRRQQCLIFINDAQQDLKKIIDEADEGFFREAVEFSVVASPNDSYEFDLPADCEYVLSAEKERSGATPIPCIETFFPTRHEGDVRPTVFSDLVPRYYVSGTKIGVIDPRDNFTLRVYYSKRLPDLEEDLDVSLIPPGFHKLVALHAARSAMGTIRQSFADGLESEYQRDLGMLSRTMDGRKRQTPRYFRYIPS